MAGKEKRYKIQAVFAAGAYKGKKIHILVVDRTKVGAIQQVRQQYRYMGKLKDMKVEIIR